MLLNCKFVFWWLACYLDLTWSWCRQAQMWKKQPHKFWYAGKFEPSKQVQRYLFSISPACIIHGFDIPSVFNQSSSPCRSLELRLGFLSNFWKVHAWRWHMRPPRLLDDRILWGQKRASKNIHVGATRILASSAVRIVEVNFSLLYQFGWQVDRCTF
jgi:hypothetical protein